MERAHTGTPVRPLRVVMLGSSCMVMLSPARTSRSVGTWAEWVPELLRARGLCVQASTSGHWHGMVGELGEDFEPAVRDAFPDVLVINYGVVESQPRVVPTWLFRNLVTWRAGSSRAASAYRARLVPVLRRGTARWQQLTAPHAPLALSRTTPRRFQLEMTRLIRRSWVNSRPLILVLEIDPVNDGLERAVPGLRERVEHYNGILRRVVAAADNPRVVLLPTGDAARAFGTDEALPDGLHRTASLHRATADLIVTAVLANADHLQLTRRTNTVTA